MAKRVIELSGETVVVGGRAITPVARATTAVVGGRSGGLVRQRLRPARLDVVERDGRRTRVPLRDLGRRIQLAVLALSALGVLLQLGWRPIRPTRRSER